MGIFRTQMKKMKREPEYLTLKEYAAFRGVTVGTIRRWIQGGKVTGSEQPYGPSGRWFIRKAQ